VHARLIEIDWPDHGPVAPPPPVTHAALTARLASLRTAMAGRGLSHLVIYGDREHFANLAWATGFDPRFEEAILVLPEAGRPVLIAGNECFDYTLTSPLVAAGEVERVRCASLSLLSQPRDTPRLGDILNDAIPTEARVGVAGWKYWGEDEVADPARALEVPALLADLLRDRAGPDRVENATDLLMHPAHGLRATVDPDEIAAMEHANAVAARAVRNLVFGLREGMSDFEALAAAGLDGAPLSCHVTFATGARAFQGLSSPTGQRLTRGSPLSFNIAPWGANICRAGWVAEGPDDLPPEARDYVEAFAGPYLAALSSWFAAMRPGTPGGAVHAQIQRDLPFDTFGVFLNPGHLIHLDEWLSSPIFAGSDIPLRSGMAMQVDIIPAHPVYGSTRMEEGIVIADAELCGVLAERHPALIARCASRRAFMREVIGLDVPETVLPLADTAGIIAPWMLAPRKVLTLR
jgi:Xaa-Pro aminopeptidase